MLSLFKNPYFISALFFATLIINHYRANTFPATKEVYIQYVDNIEPFILYKRKKADIFRYFLTHNNYHYEVSRDNMFSVPEEYQQGDYFKDLTLIYNTNNCIKSAKGFTYCRYVQVVNGTYFSQKHNKEIILNNSTTWYIFVSNFLWLIGYLFIYLFVIVLIVGYRNGRLVKLLKGEL